MEEKIYAILMDQDEITWQTILLELIKNEEMDPWDINISKLAERYIGTLKKLQEMNLHVSGKVLLAAAILLRIKSSRLVGEDLLEFDRLLASNDLQDSLYDDNGEGADGKSKYQGLTWEQAQQLKLIPRTPQPRKRKVSIYDLIDALAQALNVRHRRILNRVPQGTLEAPEKAYDITELMDKIYNDVVNHLRLSQEDRMLFAQLIPSDSKKDKVLTFIPLLHLTNARKVDLEQDQHFGDIWVKKAQLDSAVAQAKSEK
ncbi:segregation/condensation protein A [Candidatus Woesearchaeota archaeon]|nr:segregation/condensation protein A [Candidatus Woesearchaeota archaeon]